MRTLIPNVKDFMNNNSLFSERIKQERIRLGLTQQEIAEKCGVSREMWGRYERGLASPNCELLFSLLLLGIDVQYIISGLNHQAISEKERLLLILFKQSNEEVQDAILTLLYNKEN